MSNNGRFDGTGRIERDCALLVVDVQNDFCAGGALAVSGGDEVVPVLNHWVEFFLRVHQPIAYTRDWHPPDHCSFREQGGPWPVHCVQNTPGVRFHSNLNVTGALFSKAFRADVEAYSGFGGFLVDERDRITNCRLAAWLKARGVRHVYVGGLTTDYCVKTTTLDALREGFQVTVLSQAIRAVNVQPGDGEQAIEEMKRAGAELL